MWNGKVVDLCRWNFSCPKIYISKFLYEWDYNIFQHDSGFKTKVKIIRAYDWTQTGALLAKKVLPLSTQAYSPAHESRSRQVPKKSLEDNFYQDETVSQKYGISDG